MVEARHDDVAGSNLPIQLTSFVGRESQLEEVCGLVAAHRLVTLTGAGGCGKTRLALEVASRRGAGDVGLVRWVDLAPLTDPSLVATTLAAVLGMPEPPEPVVDTVVRHLAGRRALVLLDNCEHLIDACAALTSRLVQGCPGVTVLATSRELLGVAGEIRWPVPPLTLPDDDARAGGEAVRLFVERATASRPSFALTDETTRAVVTICRRLDGIPLAIELAAARVRMMSVDQIADGLADRFHLLTGGGRAALPRQRTLEGSVDWSHDLLDDRERAVFRRLAAFAGSFTLDAAESVCVGDPIVAGDVLDLLGSLVDRSLVQVVDDAGLRSRYRMLETIRDYARRKLTDAGEAEATRDRHADWCASFARRAGHGLERADQLVWLTRVDAELDNLRAALDWCAERDNRESGMAIVGELLLYWFARSEVAIGRARLEAVFDERADARLRAAALTSLCLVAYRGGAMGDAARHADDAVGVARELGDVRTVGRALHFRAWVRFWGVGDSRGAWADFEEVDELLRDGSDDVFLALNRALLGWSRVDTSRAHEARALLEETSEVAVVRANGLFALGWLDNIQGRVEEAEANFTAAMRLADEVGDQYVGLLARGLLANQAVDRGDPADARARAELGLERALEHRMPACESAMRLALALVQLAEGDPDAALTELATARERCPMPWLVAILHAFEGEAALVAGRLDEARARAEQAISLAAPGDSVSARGLGLMTLAALALADGDPHGAEDLLHETVDLTHEPGFAPVVSAALGRMAVAVAAQDRFEEAARLHGASRGRTRQIAGMYEDPGIGRARAALGDEVFETACAEGAALTLDDAVAYARRGRGARKRAPHGWDSLTPTEWKVVELVAEGLTNPQIGQRLFISARTVQTHVAHVFAKLHVATRAELAAAAASRRAGER